jgi:RsiW-degrading membrane proteinase PrsW (M82 family)/pSer/pThr/pTyr-binding forkhead associated (FHA) protein
MPTTLTLGRDPAADIIIGDPSISRRHAELVLLDDRRIFIRDLGGSSGTVRIRAGERLPIQREIVAPGDEVSFGDLVISFDSLKEMMLEKLGRAQAAAGAASLPALQGAQQAAKHDALARDAQDAGPRDRAEVVPLKPGESGSHAAAGSGFGEFVPVLGGGLARMRERGLLLPALAFAILVSRLSWLLSQDDPEAMASFVVEFSLALVFVGFIVVYRLCGKVKPWMVIAGVMAAEVVIMACHPLFDPPFCSATGAEPIIFKTMHAGEIPVGKPKPGAPAGQAPEGQPPAAQAPGGQPQGAQGPGGQGAPGDGAKRADILNASVSVPAGVVLIPGVPIEKPGFLARFWAFSTCAGLREELEKMLPVFGLLWLAGRTKRTDARRWGVFEPLDAIVYACAAATAFIIVETFGGHGYVGKVLDAARQKEQLGLAAIHMFPLAVFRTIDALTGHLAYSGYFAYFVGLGLMRPKQRERLWLGGWLVAALIHGFFDAVVDERALLGPTIATFVAFFFLIAAILNARKVSPTRDENFATRALPRERRA